MGPGPGFSKIIDLCVSFLRRARPWFYGRFVSFGPFRFVPFRFLGPMGPLALWVPTDDDAGPVEALGAGYPLATHGADSLAHLWPLSVEREHQPLTSRERIPV